MRSQINSTNQTGFIGLFILNFKNDREKTTYERQNGTGPTLVA